MDIIGRVVYIINARNRSDLQNLPGEYGRYATKFPMLFSEPFLAAQNRCMQVGSPIYVPVRGGGYIEVITLGVTMTPRVIKLLSWLNCEHLVESNIQSAINKAAEMKADVYVLTGLTGASSRGERLISRNSSLPTNFHGTTGNNLATYSAKEGTLLWAQKLGIDTRNATLAVVGGYGSIGAAYTKTLASKFGRICVIGRRPEWWLPPKKRRIRAKWQSRVLREFRGHGAVIETGLIGDLAGFQADVIAVMTTAFWPIIRPKHIAQAKPVLVVDVAVPKGVHDSVVHQCKNAKVVEGGSVAVYTPEGTLVACPFDYSPRTQNHPGCAVEGLVLAQNQDKSAATRKIRLNLGEIARIGQQMVEAGYQVVAPERTIEASGWNFTMPRCLRDTFEEAGRWLTP